MNEVTLYVDPAYSNGKGGPSLGGYVPPQCVTKPTRSTEPCIPLGSINRVPALIGWGKGGTVTSAGWQVTLQCYPVWRMNSRGSEASVRTAIRVYFTSLT